MKIEWSPAATALARQYTNLAINFTDGGRWEFEVSPFIRLR